MYINAQNVCDLLTKLVIRCCDNMPITVILDNAKYQKYPTVFRHARKAKIELLFLPPYSPNRTLAVSFLTFLDIYRIRGVDNVF